MYHRHSSSFTASASLLTLSTCAVLVAAALPGSAQAASQVQHYDIPAAPLASALNRFGQQAGLLLSFPQELVSGQHSQGLHGDYDVDTGLHLLLQGTPLMAVRQGEGRYGLQRRPFDDNTVELAATDITGNRDVLSATSEGTGTYAAQATSIFKGAKTLREIPQSVSVITRQQMDDQGFTELEDVYAQLPGARLDGYSNQQRILSRGFQTNTQIDGVPQARQEGLYTLDPAIYDRVEMLRGPAGLYTGSAEPGGTINLQRKRPLEHFALSGKTSYGSWSAARTELDVTGPLNESGTLRGRAVGVLQDKDEFYDTAHNERKVIFGTLEYDLTPQDTLGLSAASMTNVSNVFWGLPRYTDGSLPGRKTYVGTSDVHSTDTVSEFVVDYQHRFDNDWQAKATYTRRNEELHRGSAYAVQAVDRATGLANARGTYFKDELTHDAYDVNLSGPFELFGATHQATLGYNSATSLSYSPDWVSRFFTASDVLNRRQWGGFGGANNDGSKNRTEQSGAYGSLNLRVLEPLAVIVGGRTTDFAYKSRDSYTSPWLDGQHESGEFTPFGALVLDISKNISVYTSYAEIFVPQTNTDYSGGKLPPRTGEQYEIGIKGAFLQDRLNASFAIYQLRDQNRAITDYDPTHICPSNFNSLCSKAAGLIQSRGFEAEVSGTPVAGLNIAASWAFNRSVILEDADPANVGTTPTPYRNPKHLVKVWANYDFSEGPNPGVLADWNLGAGMIAQSAIKTPPDGGQDHRQGTYAVVSVDAGYRVNKHLKVDFSIDNLFDRVYLRELGADYYYNFYGDPRSYKLTLSYNY